MPPTHTPLASGQRISLRDAEFLITKAYNPKLKIDSFGKVAGYESHIVECVGTSDLVRDKTFAFDLAIDAYTVVRPEDTVLVADTSPNYRLTRLLLESRLRTADVSHKEIALADKAALNVYDYQLDPARKALQTPFARILIADAVGLGKTAEVGILLTELMRRGRGRRILVLALKSVLAQFQQELWDRFAIPLMRLDSEGVSELRARLPSSKNPFNYYDKVIVSIDTLKQSLSFQHYLERTHWDVVVIDECHNVANATSQRGNLAQLLARKCDNLIFTSATPHNGDNAKFANLMRMLEPTTAPVRPEKSGEAGDTAADLGFDLAALNRHVIRRSKKDLPASVQKNFSERELHRETADLLPPEITFLRWLKNYRDEERQRKGARLDALFSVGLLKAYLSSPLACRESIHRRLKENERQLDSDTEHKPRKAARLAREQEVLPEGLQLLDEVLTAASFGESPHDVTQDAKLRTLLSLLKTLKWPGTKASERIVLFAERIETLEYLEGAIREHYGLPTTGTDDVRGHSITTGIARFDGSLSDIQQQHVIEDFGRESSATRLLLTSDAGSQGVNLHYECHRMINYDLPWSLITLEQRNGRIDRYGQNKTPHIHYIIAESADDSVDTDLRIVDRIREKEDYAYHTLGDAGAITALYDAEAEERRTSEAIVEGNTEFLEAQAKQAGGGVTLDDLFAELATQEQAQQTSPSPAQQLTLVDTAAPTHPRVTSLYASDEEFYNALINYLLNERILSKEKYASISNDLHEVERTKELREVLFGVPREALANKQIKLSLKPAPVMEAIERARKTGGAWTGTQLLYDGHPLARNWMQKVAMQLADGEAPVARLRVLPKGEAYYCFYGEATNDLGTSLLSEFYVVPVDFADGDDARPGKPTSLNELFAKPELADERQVWSDRITDAATLARLTALLPEVVDMGRLYYLDPKLEALRQNMQRKEHDYQQRLDAWYGTDLPTPASSDTSKLSKPEQRALTAYEEGRERYARYTSMRAGTHVQLMGVFHNHPG